MNVNYPSLSMYGRAHHLFIHLRCTDKQTATQLTVLGTLRLGNGIEPFVETGHNGYSGEGGRSILLRK